MFLWCSCPSSSRLPQHWCLASPVCPSLLLHLLDHGALLPSLWYTDPHPPQAVPTQPLLALFWELTSVAQVLGASPLRSVSGCCVLGSGTTHGLCGSLCFAILSLADVVFLWGTESLSLSRLISLSVRPHRLGIPSLFHSSFSGALVLSWFFSFFSLSSLFSPLLFYPVIWRFSCPFVEVWGLLPVFGRCSVRIVRIDKVFGCICGRRWFPCPTALPS